MGSSEENWVYVDDSKHLFWNFRVVWNVKQLMLMVASLINEKVAGASRKLGVFQVTRLSFSLPLI